MGRNGLARALGLTVAATFVWGVAHLAAGRRVVGGVLLGLYLAIIAAAAVAAATVSRGQFERIAVRHTWLDGITAGIIVLALAWAVIVVHSHLVVRPAVMRRRTRATAWGLVAVLVIAVCGPLVWAARYTHIYRSTLTTVFHGEPGHVVNADDPWKNTPRVNILLLGGDGAADRTGVRTDSMTVASVDTRTGNTVLFGIPRNLQHVPMPPRLLNRFPAGFVGDDAAGQGLINEIYQYAEDHPEVMPGYPAGQRGAELDREVVGDLLGIHIDYYVLMNLFGFADLVDAMGGVTLNVASDIPYGGPEDGSAPTGVVKAGYRKLNGHEALWYGRSRDASDDYSRMARQKCLLRAITDQADPERLLTKFGQIASAVKKTVSTNMPAELLPALIKLSGTVKHGPGIRSLLLVPPLIETARPDVALIQKLTAAAIAGNDGAARRPSAPTPVPTASATPTAPATPAAAAAPGTPAPSVTATAPNGDPIPGSGTGAQTRPVPLASVCP